MVFRMKTTLIIDDNIFTRVKEEAARRRTTISEIVEGALRAHLQPKPDMKELPPLPTWNSGGLLIDVSNREAMYEFFDTHPDDEPE